MLTILELTLRRGEGGIGKMLKPVECSNVQMQKCSTVQISFYCQGGGAASDLGDRWGHWQNVHIRLQATGQPLNFGNLGADVRQKIFTFVQQTIFYCGFILSWILISFY